MKTYHRFDVQGNGHVITHGLVFDNVFAEWDGIVGGIRAAYIANATAHAVIASLEAEEHVCLRCESECDCYSTDAAKCDTCRTCQLSTSRD